MHYLELEKEFADFIHTKKCISVSTGTAALHLALEALQLPADSKVIVPDFTMYATALAVYYARLQPVFVDCDDNLLIDLDKAEEIIDEKTKVLMVTHIYGRIVDMDRVMHLAKKYNLRVIEDACEVHGAMWNGKPAGSFDIGCFSFYNNKIVHGEEGGAITSNDTNLLKIANDMKSMSFGETHNFFHSQIGFNYRMINSQAAMILDSLHEVQDNLKKRQEITNKFNSLFDKKFQMPNNREVVWVYDLCHPRADTVVKRLKDIGISARHSFKPMSLMPLFNDNYRKNTNAYLKSNEVFYLNIDISWNDKTITEVCEKTSTIMEEEL